MAYLEAPRSGTDIAAGTYVLGPGTLISAAVAVCLAQVALAIPAVLNGMLTTDPGPGPSQLTWRSRSSPPPGGTPSRPRPAR